MNYRATLSAAAQASLLFLSGLFLPLLGMILAPIPLVLVSIRTGRAEGLAATGISFAIAGFAVSGVIGWPAATALPLGYGLMAWGIAEGIRQRWKPESTALVGGLLPSAILMLSAARFFLHLGKNPVTFLEQLFQEQRTLNVKLYTDLKLAEFAAMLSSVPDSLIHNFILVLPGILIASLLLVATFCLALSTRLLARRPGTGQAPSATPLSAWHAPDIWVWGLIATLILIMVRIQAVKFAGWNIAIVYAVVYLTQGVALVDYMFKKLRIMPIMRGILYLIILVFPTVVASIVVLGVVDIWADFRKVRGPVLPS